MSEQQDELFRRMTPEQKFAAMWQLKSLAIQLRRARVVRQHPNATAEEIDRVLLQEVLQNTVSRASPRRSQ